MASLDLSSPEKLGLALEAEQRGILPTEQQSLLDEARVRGIVPEEKLPPLTFPEFRSAVGGLAGGDMKRFSELSNAIDLPRSVAGKVDAIKAALPEARFGATPEGHVYVQVNDQNYMLNKPGFTAQDMSDLGTEILFQAPMIMLGGKGGGALLGHMGRAIGSGSGAAAGSLSRDIAASQVGDKQGPDIANMGFSGAGGAIFEGFAPMAVNLLRRLFTSGKYFDSTLGTLTQDGRDVLTRAGIDPDSVTPEFVAEFNAVAGRGVTPEQAIAVAEANTMVPPVKLSRGDVTRTRTDQGLEDAALKGAMGEDAEQLATAFRREQQGQLAANRTRIQDSVAGGQASVTEAGQGVSAAREALVQQRAALRKEVGAAYDAARARGASVVSEGVAGLHRHTSKVLGESYNPGTAPKAFRTVEELSRVLQAGDGVRVSAVNVRHLESYRQQLAALARGSDAVEASAAREAIKAYDDYMGEVLEQGLIRGDEAALEAFRHARSLRRQLGEKFEGDRLFESILEEAGGELKLTPTEALNKLFMSSTLGGKQGSVKALQRMRKLLGEDSPEWLAMKEEAFMRLLKAQDAAADDVGMQFVNAFRKAMSDHRELMRTVFTPEEITQMARLANVARSATGRVPGAVNTSSTAILDRIINSFGFLGQATKAAAGGALKGVGSGMRASRVRQSLEDSMPAPPVFPSGPGGMLGSEMLRGIASPAGRR